MHIGVPLETHAGETRVAATPETVKKLVAQGHQVTVQTGAGVSASIPDSAYAAVGASIGSDAAAFAADGAKWQDLRIDGGMSANDWMAQDLADVLAEYLASKGPGFAPALDGRITVR